MRARVWIGGLIAIALVAAACGSTATEDTQAPVPTTLGAIDGISSETTNVPTTAAAKAPGGPSTTRVPVPPPTTTPPLPTTTTTTLPPVFEYSIESVTEETVSLTWREECPLHWSELSLLTLTYWDFHGEAIHGEMVINSAVATDVVTVFRRLFDIGFPIERMALVDDYGGDDKAAMAANVTSGFNCRYVDGTERWSNHAFGLAIDINPLINPWAREDDVLPIEGTRYAFNRDDEVPGMINLGDPVIDAFADVGWSWGGVWTAADYMHFSQPGN